MTYKMKGWSPFKYKPTKKTKKTKLRISGKGSGSKSGVGGGGSATVTYTPNPTVSLHGGVSGGGYKGKHGKSSSISPHFGIKVNLLNLFRKNK